ncbi:DNA-processing protein DprA [Patescibacteria group bacterium]|nr:DNA-processing protein DprA [Patescibacteria group bacterium]
MEEETKFAFLFSLCEGIGYQKVKSVREYYGSLARGWDDFDYHVAMKMGISKKLWEKWIIHRNKVSLEEELEKLSEYNIDICSVWDDKYPEMLKEIYSPPTVLYGVGDMSILDKMTVAVVGTRIISLYGERVLYELVGKIVDSGIVIVSGLAMGVDAMSHQLCVENGGLTVGVLAGGLDMIQPTINQRLGEKIIAEGGLLVSEYAVGIRPMKFNFPARNRIVSGLSRGVLVVEAPEKSGALITANFALEQNRSVMAIPGNINQDNSVGCNDLIKKGARMVTSIDDIVEELGLGLKATKSKIDDSDWKPGNQLQQKIFAKLKEREYYTDEMVEELKATSAEIVVALNLMAIEGVVVEEAGGVWRKVK